MRKPLVSTLRGASIFLILMRRTAPVLPIDLIEPAEPLSHAIKGRPAHGLTPNPFPFSIAERFPILYNDILR